MFRLSLWLGDSHQFDVKCSTAAQVIRLGRLWCLTEEPRPWWNATKPRKSTYSLSLHGDPHNVRLLTSVPSGWKAVPS